MSIKAYWTLEQATRHRSKTLPFPFVVAQECNEPYVDKDTGEERIRTRQYYAFDDVDTYLSVMEQIPHCHEMVYPRILTNAESPLQQGRIAFDIDVSERLYKDKFVHDSFVHDLWDCIGTVLTTYYTNVDMDKVIPIWFHTPYKAKLSIHLILYGAYLCSDWVAQLQSFYRILFLVAARHPKLKQYKMDEIIDTQIARNNGSLRMLHNSKLNKKVTKRLMDPNQEVDFHMCLIQQFRAVDAENEQRITDNQLQLDKIIALEPQDAAQQRLKDSIPQLKQVLVNREADDIDVSDIAVAKIVQILQERYEDQYRVEEGRTGDEFTLTRHSSGPCPVSNREHDKIDAYAKITHFNNDDPNLYSIIVGCFRDNCVTVKGSKIVVIEKIIIDEDKTVIVEKPEKERSKKKKNREKRVNMANLEREWNKTH